MSNHANNSQVDIYAGHDPRALPSYTIPEAAHYLNLPRATLRSWVKGQHYRTGGGRKFFHPLIALPDRNEPVLSFINLTEAYVLSAIRREHRISLQQVRSALRYLERQCHSRHPLAEEQFVTDGSDLFVQRINQLINLSQEGQLEMRDLLRAYLRRIERDPSGTVLRLYPLTRRGALDQPRWVVIDPYVAFGKPVLSRKGIRTSIIAERYKSGDSPDDLAKDYGCERTEIEEAIRCELQVEAA